MTPTKRLFPRLLLTSPFFVFFGAQLIRHDLWRDELNVYGIAHASPTLGSLIWHVNHEGHPLVWYLVIWLASKLISSVLVLKVVQGVVGAGIILMVGLWSPFTTLERVLLLLSYFLFFEYTVLSRMYGLCVLMAFLFLWRRIYRPDSFLINAILLGLLANTDTLGLMFSGAFGLEYAVNRFRANTDKKARWRLALAGCLYVAFVAFCYFTIKPPADISWRTTGRPLRQVSEISHDASVLVEYFALPWFPIRFASHLKPHHYWNPTAKDHPALYASILIPILAAYFLTFRRDRDLLAIFAGTSLSAAIFAVIVFSGNMRNWGITFIAYVAALWLQRFRRPGVPVVSTILLSLSAVSGILFSVLMWRRPFSSAEATAGWLKSNHFQNAALIATPDTSVAAIAILLKRPIYYLDCRCSDDYMLFSSRRDNYNEKDMPAYTVEAFERFRTSQLVLLLIEPLRSLDRRAIEQAGAQIKLLAQFTGAEAPDEDFYIYKVEKGNQSFSESRNLRASSSSLRRPSPTLGNERSRLLRLSITAPATTIRVNHF